ncbi:MAG TPA: PfaD family polyunsaturated fatty acid/polyketide biosynthesis protein [Urbifossiella sp.]|nr:PfaD family polyunsaturated fatty acid/polyketide biosynthesis protein [Urbifossiella sp.]
MEPIACWEPGAELPAFRPAEIVALAQRVRESVSVVRETSTGLVGLGSGGSVHPYAAAGSAGYGVLASLPGQYPEWLGDRSFLEAHRVRFAYVVGEMANGIATARMVSAAARAGLLGFFGAGGLSLARIEEGVAAIRAEIGDGGASWGCNLIHSPAEPRLEEATVDLFLRAGVRRASASAFMSLSPHVVWYAYRGATADAQGRPRRANHVFAKVSRPEVAEAFIRPAPERILTQLVQQGKLTELEAKVGSRLPVAQDVTAEADSGGHTDNRPLGVLLPVLCLLRDRIQTDLRYEQPVRVGAAGGLGNPSAVAAAFGLGASYVLTGSVNQAAVEAGVAPDAKALLARAGMADVAMAPAADMFEQGVRLQVLKRGTMFPGRAARLYDLYRRYESLEAIPDADRASLEKQIFGQPLETVWQETLAFWQAREPEQARRAQADPHHRMALVFRWYLGKASRWAIDGTPGRTQDYQVWCGPAMGAFNAWVRGSFLEVVENRTVAQIALNLLEGATAVQRAQQLRSFGVPVPAEAFDFRPRMLC